MQVDLVSSGEEVRQDADVEERSEQQLIEVAKPDGGAWQPRLEIDADHGWSKE